MSIQSQITLPAYTPTRWRLRLPDYPIITNSWRSSAFPEILGSFPNGAEWSLEFDNMTNAEALALLLPWRATGGGQWGLTTLPAALAGGCNDDNFRKRLTGTTWSILREPQKVPVKNGRFNVTIDLIHELTFSSVYGPGASPFDLGVIPVKLNRTNILVVAGLPTSLVRRLPLSRAAAGPVLELELAWIDDLDPIAFPTSLVRRLPLSREAGPVLELDLDFELTVAAVSPAKA